MPFPHHSAQGAIGHIRMAQLAHLNQRNASSHEPGTEKEGGDPTRKHGGSRHFCCGILGSLVRRISFVRLMGSVLIDETVNSDDRPSYHSPRRHCLRSLRRSFVDHHVCSGNSASDAFSSYRTCAAARILGAVDHHAHNGSEEEEMCRHELLRGKYTRRGTLRCRLRTIDFWNASTHSASDREASEFKITSCFCHATRTFSGQECTGYWGLIHKHDFVRG